ncbi:MAG: hypothetical protein IJ866_01770 [Alphaproteobacteria bacterium]|nr:hypothetical protein [Alphaproteobacteria bacterium]
MIQDTITTLKDIAKEQTVSVEYYQNGKCYRIPMAAFFLDISYDPFDDEDEDMSLYINCDYIMVLGTPYMRFSVSDIDHKLIIAPIIVPFDKKKQNRVHREILSLVNICSKRIIAQEISRNKYAVASAINSIVMNQEYS